MTKFLSAAAAVALVLTASTAEAASPSAQANGTARILKALTIEQRQNLDFGTIVLAGGTFAGEVVRVPISGTIVCGGGVNVTCVGTSMPAKFHLQGTNNAAVTVNSPAFDLTGPASAKLTVTPSSTTQTVNLGAAGLATGIDVLLGGSITLASTTQDGTYTGVWTVTADYQ